MTEPKQFLTEDGTLVNASRAYIDPQKLIGYSLDAGHSRGGNKAFVRERVLGYNRVNADKLEERIMEELPTAPAWFRGRTVHGMLFGVDLAITGPTGRQAILRTGWIFRPGESFPRLTTAFVRRRRSDAKTTLS